MTRTIKDVEAQVEEKLADALKELNLLPQGYRFSVRLHGKSKDKKRNASFETSWVPDTDTIYISFERIPQSAQQPARSAVPAVTTVTSPEPGLVESDKISDLVRALDRAEARREPSDAFALGALSRAATALPLEGFAWVSVDSERRRILSEAIDRRLILLNKIPNPKSPQFPVTTIRLNRLVPEVKAILGDRDTVSADFQPVVIRGENLSTTVLRDRR
jgi:hypothetical protein